jgi:hypothetical protein
LIAREDAGLVEAKEKPPRPVMFGTSQKVSTARGEETSEAARSSAFTRHEFVGGRDCLLRTFEMLVVVLGRKRRV